MVVGTRQAGGDVGGDHVVPAIQRHQPVERGEFDADPPFVRRNLALQGARARHRSVGHGRLPLSVDFAASVALWDPHVKAGTNPNQRSHSRRGVPAWDKTPI